MTEIYLIRHGQTAWNKELRFRGRVDIPLNEQGIREARAIADALRNKTIDAIYTSPLRRSIETAQPVAELLHLEIVPVQEFIDISYGEWEGLLFSEVKIRYKDLYRKWEESPNLIQFPRGESLDEVRERSYFAFNDIVRRELGNSIVVIPHRVINKVLLCALLGLNNSYFWKIKQDTGCINLIEYSDSGFVIAKMNDTCHLKELEAGEAQPDF